MTTPAPALGGAVAAYLKQLRTESTRHTYSRALDPMVAHFGKNTPLASLEADDIAEWFAGQWGELSDGTIAVRASSIRSAAAWWRGQGWINEDAAAQLPGWIRPRPVQPGEQLTPEEVEQLLGACDRRSVTGIRTRALIMLLYRSGLRIGEALTARSGDFDLRNHSVLLRTTKAGRKQTRGWHPSADGDLLRWMDKRRELGIRQGAMFCGTDGKPIAQDSFRRTLGRLAARAGIDEKRVHPHAFRHTFAAELRRDGASLEDIQDLLGHSSLAITQVYLKDLTNGEAVDRLQLANLPDVGGGQPAELVTAEEKIAAMQRQIEELQRAVMTLAQPGKQPVCAAAGAPAPTEARPSRPPRPPRPPAPTEARPSRPPRPPRPPAPPREPRDPEPARRARAELARAANLRRTMAAGARDAELARKALDILGDRAPQEYAPVAAQRAARPEASWTEIGAGLGMTKDAAVGRFRRLIRLAGQPQDRAETVTPPGP